MRQIDWNLAYDAFATSGTATVALIDTGVDETYSDLASNVVVGRSILDGSNGPPNSHGHGTVGLGNEVTAYEDPDNPPAKTVCD